MEVNQIRIKMMELEENINKLIRNFTEECGVEISDVVFKKDVFDGRSFGIRHHDRS